MEEDEHWRSVNRRRINTGGVYFRRRINTGGVYFRRRINTGGVYYGG